jgi:hypothetical protein
MHTRSKSLVIALAMAAAPHGVVAQPERHLAAGLVDILVNGVPQRHYAHEGRSYVEALKGKEYAIRLRNPYPVRVAVALSVDGLNTIDARHTTASDARKRLIDPYQTVTISGWQVNSTEARRFEFTTEARSYGQALGQTANLGIISAVFFKERPPALVRETSSDSRARRGAAPETEASSTVSGRNEYAATGMGQRTSHTVTQVWLDLERAASDAVDIRYEFRPQLRRLGILLATPIAKPLVRRGHARGFEEGFSPEVDISPRKR